MTLAPTRDTAEFTDLRCAVIDGTVALPADPAYARCAPWNVAVAVEPAAVVFARSARDVAETVRFAGIAGYTVAVAATGHGALPVGPDTILLHTGEMTGCDVDPDARVGAHRRGRHLAARARCRHAVRAGAAVRVVARRRCGRDS